MNATSATGIISFLSNLRSRYDFHAVLGCAGLPVLCAFRGKTAFCASFYCIVRIPSAPRLCVNCFVIVFSFLFGSSRMKRAQSWNKPLFCVQYIRAPLLYVLGFALLGTRSLFSASLVPTNAACASLALCLDARSIYCSIALHIIVVIYRRAARNRAMRGSA